MQLCIMYIYVYAPRAVAVVPGKPNFVLGFAFKLIFHIVKYAKAREKKKRPKKIGQIADRARLRVEARFSSGASSYVRNLGRSTAATANLTLLCQSLKTTYRTF